MTWDFGFFFFENDNIKFGKSMFFFWKIKIGNMFWENES